MKHLEQSRLYYLQTIMNNAEITTFNNLCVDINSEIVRLKEICRLDESIILQRTNEVRSLEAQLSAWNANAGYAGEVLARCASYFAALEPHERHAGTDALMIECESLAKTIRNSFP